MLVVVCAVADSSAFSSPPSIFTWLSPYKIKFCVCVELCVHPRLCPNAPFRTLTHGRHSDGVCDMNRLREILSIRP